MSFDFIIRIIGMLVMGGVGGYWGYDFAANSIPDQIVGYSLGFALLGALSGRNAGRPEPRWDEGRQADAELRSRRGAALSLDRLSRRHRLRAGDRRLPFLHPRPDHLGGDRLRE